MPVFIIKDADGNTVNTINADLAFVQANFDYYEEYQEPTPPEPTAEELAQQAKAEARQWRNSELERTDAYAVLPDYPNKEALLTYRQALRDWTDTEDFPETRPTLEG